VTCGIGERRGEKESNVFSLLVGLISVRAGEGAGAGAGAGEGVCAMGCLAVVGVVACPDAV
jgi:hypothetical protein